MSILPLLALFWAHFSSASVLPSFFHGDLVIFGDSLSDDGIRIQPPDLDGFKRSSNGQIWSEYLADMLGLVDSCGHRKPTINLAYSGALTGQDNYYFKNWSGLHWQIAKFLNESKDSVDPATTIFFIQAGVNDLFDKINNTALVVENLLTAVQTLGQAGFKNIVLFTVSEISRAFGFQEKYASLKEPVKKLVEEANELLGPRVQQFRGANSQLDLVLADYNSMWPEVEQKFAYPTTAFNYRTMNPSPGDIKEYAWWDEWHPATGVQEILAQNVVEAMRKEFGDLLITPWGTLRDLCLKKLYGRDTTSS